MKRRSALAAVLASLAGCGGGGGGTSEAAASVAQQGPAPEPAPAPALPLSIAAWGDSLTVGYAPALAAAFTDRTVYNGGVGGETSSQILTRVQADQKGRNAWINVFMMGRNNYNRPDQVRADIAAAVAWLAHGNEKFVVVSVLNGSFGGYEIKGGTGYNQITELNASLATLYAGHYLDLRAYLVQQYDPTSPQDIIDFGRDIVPTSLRSDAIHLNAKGAQLAAARVRQYILDAGW